MTSKSEELCRLLEIKPQWIIITKCPKCFIFCDCDENGVINKYKTKDIAEYALSKNKDLCEDIDTYATAVYPDLTKPSNFVKLLEDIKINGIELCDWLLTYSGSFSNRENFIKKLILQIKEGKKCLNKDIEAIIKQAQQTEWEY